jgi:ABC-type lipoprotein release transport system permease subunit
MTALVRLLVRIGLVSLVAHRTKSLIVGGLMAFGAFLVVVSLALLDSVERATRASIVQSVSGDMQVYDKNAPDKLAIFGGIGFGSDDVGEIKSFSAIEGPLAAIPNVRSVVPMGIANANVSAPGDLDRVLNELRDAARRDDKAAIRALGQRTQVIARTLKEQMEKQAVISDGGDAAALATLTRATEDALYEELVRDPLTTLDWLDVKLAPLGEQGNQFYLRLVGTDVEKFRQGFARVRMVEGEMMPPGTRGVIVGKSLLDNRVKLPLAMNLDMVANERSKGNTIADSAKVQDLLRKAKRQSSRISYLLPPADVPVVEARIRAANPSLPTGSFNEMMAAFLEMTDENFEARYALFYDVIAPRVQLYPFKVGDTITLTSFTKTGYIRSVNAKVWGIYTVDGLENSDIAGALSITDLMTFRDLYGQRTAEFDSELAAMKVSANAATIDREDAEAALFGDTDEVAVADAEVVAPVVDVDRDEAIRAAIADAQANRTDQFDPVKAKEGVVISAAILLEDPSRARQTMKRVEEVGAQIGLQVVDWRGATGVIGQMTLVVSGVLFIAIFILFLVTIVIVNNSMVMATLERVAEFGTLRAIGAQKRFIYAMVVFETAVLGILAASVGAIAGMLVITYLGQVGIPATAQLIEVLFGGPRLFPTFTASNVVAGLVSTLIVSVAATLFPATMATRVEPVVAMQGKE